MTKNITNNEKTIISLRLRNDEHELLKKLAQESFLTVSNYIRYRIFEETKFKPEISEHEESIINKSKFACDHDREMMCLQMREFLYIKELARKALEPGLFDRCNEQALSFLKKWGYEQ